VRKDNYKSDARYPNGRLMTEAAYLKRKGLKAERDSKGVRLVKSGPARLGNSPFNNKNTCTTQLSLGEAISSTGEGKGLGKSPRLHRPKPIKRRIADLSCCQALLALLSIAEGESLVAAVSHAEACYRPMDKEI